MPGPSIIAEPSITQLIIIGAVGGGVAAISATAVTFVAGLVRDAWLMNKIYLWLAANSSDNPTSSGRYRSTRAIASWNNISEDRVRDLCSRSSRIHLSTGTREDRWGIHKCHPQRKPA